MSDAFGYAFSLLKGSVIAKKKDSCSLCSERQIAEGVCPECNTNLDVAKALNPSMQDDPNMNVGQRHHRNLERQKNIHTQQPNLRGPMRMGRQIPNVDALPPPMPPKRVVYRDAPQHQGNRTLPPNPAQMPIGAGAPSMREAGGGPPPAFGFPQPVSQENPFVNAMHPDAAMSDERIKTLSDEFRIPIEKAWSHLRYR